MPDRRAPGAAFENQQGLSSLEVAPRIVANRPALLIERYDRASAGGAMLRLHQEDFCQALGYPGELKYESQGGPGLAACSQLVRRLGLGPAAVQGLLDWVAFNALLGNADAHAKNLALLCDAKGRRRLAPFYDLVPTLVLPESLIDRTPALRIGAATRIDAIGADDWRAVAREAGYAPRFVLGRVAELADAVLERLPATGAAIVGQGSNETRIQRVTDVIADHVRRIRDGIAWPASG